MSSFGMLGRRITSHAFGIMILGLLVATLTGCGFAQSMDTNLEVNYAIISEAATGGLLAAEGTVCKVTTVGDVDGWEVSFKGKKCKANLRASKIEKPNLEGD